jgi:hypothetical protein
LTRAELIADIAADNPHLRVVDLELVVSFTSRRSPYALAMEGL